MAITTSKDRAKRKAAGNVNAALAVERTIADAKLEAFRLILKTELPCGKTLGDLSKTEASDYSKRLVALAHILNCATPGLRDDHVVTNGKPGRPIHLKPEVMRLMAELKENVGQEVWSITSAALEAALKVDDDAVHLGDALTNGVAFVTEEELAERDAMFN